MDSSDLPEAGKHVDLKGQEMQELADKYCTTILHRRLDPASPQASESTPKSTGTNSLRKTLVVTGTTGRLGCHLLAQLLQKPDVTRVYALNRVSQRSKVSLAERQRDIFVECGLDVQLLESPKLALIAGDTSKDHLGLGEQKYSELRESVTDIIHNAWRVSFQVPLAANEPLIVGVRNLINLTLESPRSLPPRFLYVSSINAIRNRRVSTLSREEPTVDPRIAFGDGYGESKWVAEQLCLYARSRGARASFVRVGQLSGDTRTGSWAPREWVGHIVSTARIVDCLPSRPGDLIFWLPIDEGATAIIDFLESNEPVVHLIHPLPAHWDVILGAAAKYLGVRLVPYAQWLSALEAATTADLATSQPSAMALATARLLPFLHSIDENWYPGAKYETRKAVANSQTLASIQPFTPEHFIKSVRYWGNAGLLKL